MKAFSPKISPKAQARFQMARKKGASTAKAGQEMAIDEAGSAAALSTDLKNAQERMAPGSDYTSA